MAKEAKTNAMRLLEKRGGGYAARLFHLPPIKKGAPAGLASPGPAGGVLGNFREL